MFLRSLSWMILLLVLTHEFQAGFIFNQSEEKITDIKIIAEEQTFYLRNPESLGKELSLLLFQQKWSWLPFKKGSETYDAGNYVIMQSLVGRNFTVKITSEKDAWQNVVEHRISNTNDVDQIRYSGYLGGEIMFSIVPQS